MCKLYVATYGYPVAKCKSYVATYNYSVAKHKSHVVTKCISHMLQHMTVLLETRMQIIEKIAATQMMMNDFKELLILLTKTMVCEPNHL